MTRSLYGEPQPANRSEKFQAASQQPIFTPSSASINSTQHVDVDVLVPQAPDFINTREALLELNEEIDGYRTLVHRILYGDSIPDRSPTETEVRCSRDMDTVANVMRNTADEVKESIEELKHLNKQLRTIFFNA